MTNYAFIIAVTIQKDDPDTRHGNRTETVIQKMSMDADSYETAGTTLLGIAISDMARLFPGFGYICHAIIPDV